MTATSWQMITIFTTELQLIEISGKVDKSNTYNWFCVNISIFFNRRTSSDYTFFTFFYILVLWVKNKLMENIKLSTVVEGDPMAFFSIATTPRCRGGRYSLRRKRVDRILLWYLLLLFPLHLCKKTCLFLTIFTNPSTRAGYDTRSIFKRSLTGFYLEFSFS